MQLIAWVLSPNLKVWQVLSQSVLENKSPPKNPFIWSNMKHIYNITSSCLRIHKYATRTISPSFSNNNQLEKSKLNPLVAGAGSFWSQEYHVPRIVRPPGPPSTRLTLLSTETEMFTPCQDLASNLTPPSLIYRKNLRVQSTSCNWKALLGSYKSMYSETSIKRTPSIKRTLSRVPKITSFIIPLLCHFTI